MRLAHDTELKLLNSSCLRQRVSCIHHSKAGQSTSVATVLVSPSPDDVFTRLGHGAGTKSTQWDRRAKSGLVRNMDNVNTTEGEELHQQIFAALTIRHRTMVGSGPGHLA